jgi:hypothetical protein
MSVSSVLSRLVLSTLLGTALLACGSDARVSPSEDQEGERPGQDDDDDDCVASAEQCTGGQDEDCDGDLDCADSDCYGVEGCGSCGELDLTESQPLALPDGVGMSYMTSIDITGFGDGQAMTATSDVLGVCVVMEHSWLRDLEMSITCPSGKEILLQKFLGQSGGELHMGEPNDSDNFDPVPGVGGEYCWTPSAVNPPMLGWGDQHPIENVLPPGDYQASDTFDSLIGCTLNGDWTIRVTDDWGQDNGFIFSWGVKFNPDTVPDCADWPVE